MRFLFSVIALFVSLLFFSQTDTGRIIKFIQIAEAYENKGPKDSVLIYHKQALTLSEKNSYKWGIAKSSGGLGRIYMSKGNYPEALQYFFKALKIYEELGHKPGVLVQNGNIGVVYDNQGDYSHALDYYFKALKISEAIKDNKHASVQLCNIAIVHSRQQDFNKAKDFFFRALAIDQQLNNHEGVARNLANIGNIYSEQGDNKVALDYHLKALSQAEKLNNQYLLTGSLANVGSVYGYLKDGVNAELFMLRALEEAEKTDDADLKSQIEMITSEIYEEIKNPAKALIHYKNYILLRDSVYNEENTRKSVRSEMNYLFEKKEAQTKHEHDIKVLKLEADNRLHKQLWVFLVVVSLLLAGLLILGKLAYNSKKKTAEFMLAENQRKEVLLEEVHHRINNNLQIISSLLTLQANSLEDEKLTEYLKQSQNRIQSLAVLHELLYHNESPLEINMNQYLNKVLDYHRQILETLPGKIEMEVTVTETYFPTKLAVPLALIVNELITNSIKYAFKDKSTGKIKVSLTPFLNEKDGWVLAVSDNGIGLPEEGMMRKESLGIRLVSILTRQIKGFLTRSNSPGASFEIVFSKS